MPDLKMPNINRVELAGRLVRAPESRTIGATGSTVCSFDVAVSRHYKAKDGTPKEETVFIGVEAWHKTAHYCADTLKKGSPVLVEGSLKMDEWTDKATGAKRTKLFVSASRVQGLAWDDKDAPAPQPAQRDDPKPKDDVPF